MSDQATLFSLAPYNPDMAFDQDALPVPDLGLKCLRCAHPLAALSRRRCPECGRPFTMEEHIPQGDYPMVILEGKPVQLDAGVRELLRRARIPFLDRRAPVDQLYGLGGLTDRGGLLGVPRDCYFEVIDLLRRRVLGEPMPDFAEPDGPDWACGSCGEQNPGTFEVCWSCGERFSESV